MFLKSSTPAQSYERKLISILAAVQFTHILDFVVIMPLAPVFMRELGISLPQFSWLASSYMVASAAAALGGTFILDKFARKTVMLTCYSGFLLATLVCALATTYPVLILGRVIAGIFGGAAGSLIFAILGDEVAPERRGRATGIVMSAFALASVLGLPIGLYLATHMNWHMPFFIVLLIGVPAWFIMHKTLPRMDKHLVNKKDRTPLETIQELVRHPHHWWAILLSMCITSSGFMIIPMISPYFVKNVGFPEKDLPLLYLVGGLLTLVTTRIFGTLTDKYTPKKLFPIVALFSIIPMLWLTHLPPVSVVMALVVSTFFMVMMNGRFTVYMTMMSGLTKPELRGGFMSLNTFFYQMAMAACTSFVGHLVIEQPDGTLKNYNYVGWISAAFVILAIFISTKIKTTSNPPKSVV